MFCRILILENLIIGIASQEGNETCVRLLLMQGASPLVSDHCGRNAIKIAAKSGHNNIVKLLEQFCPVKSESNINNFILVLIKILFNKI